MQKRLSGEGLSFLKQCEGLRLSAYQCSAGRWTIGYGSTYIYDRRVISRDYITIEMAESLLINEANRIADDLNSVLKDTLPQNKFDALVSFIYNVGFPRFSKSTLLKMVNDNFENKEIAAQFARWNKIKINSIYTVDKGLAKRRQKEIDLYFS